MELKGVQQLFNQALQNDQKIDATELKAIQAGIEADKTVTAEEIQLLTDALTQNKLDTGAVPAAIQFIAAGVKEPEAKPETAAKPEAAKEEEKSPWDTKYEVKGSFNHTSVSGGWEGQYGTEKTATKVEGSVQADINYQKGRAAWKNRVLVEYGNTFVKGDTDQKRAISRDNLEFTTEAAYTINQKGNFKIEVPYGSLYTKGPISTLEGRKFRETTGVKVSYNNKEAGSEASVKVGAGFQQENVAGEGWTNEAGVELVVEAKQSMGFMKAPLVSAFGAKSENVTFLDRLEANAQVNAFNPVSEGFDAAKTDVGVKVSARYYVNESKSVWVGVGNEWRYGGQEDSSWENKFTTDVGFKFD